MFNTLPLGNKNPLSSISLNIQLVLGLHSLRYTLWNLYILLTTGTYHIFINVYTFGTCISYWRRAPTIFAKDTISYYCQYFIIVSILLWSVPDHHQNPAIVNTSLLSITTHAFVNSRILGTSIKHSTYIKYFTSIHCEKYFTTLYTDNYFTNCK